MQKFSQILAGIGTIACVSMVLCMFKILEIINTVWVWGYSTPAVFTPWLQGLSVSIIICLLASSAFAATSPGCYRKAPRDADEAGDEVIVCLPPERDL